MSIYEDTIRRVQLVSGLLEQTSIQTAIDRLSTTLGLELVDALERYSSVLDVFDEVCCVIVIPLSTVGYTSVSASVIHSRQWYN